MPQLSVHAGTGGRGEVSLKDAWDGVRIGENHSK